MALIHRSPVSITDSQVPRLYRDRLVNSGTFLLMDFGNSYSYRRKGTSSPNPITGDILYNLDETTPNGTINAASSTYSGNGLVAPDFTANNNVDFGTSFIPDNRSYLVLCWVKAPAANTNAFRGIFGRSSTSPSGSSFTITNGTTNGSFNWDMKLPGSTTVAIPGISASTVYQLAMSLELSPSGTAFKFFKNGVQFASGSAAATTVAHVAGIATGAFKWSQYGQMAGSLYRVLVEDLTTSGKLPADQVALDYALNSSKYS